MLASDGQRRQKKQNILTAAKGLTVRRESVQRPVRGRDLSATKSLCIKTQGKHIKPSSRQDVRTAP